MERMKLNKTTVAEAGPGFLWDSMLPAFGLRVLASGRKSYVVRYRTATGTDRLLTLGTAAEITPEEAREKARIVRVAAKNGEDPKADRVKARNAPRLADLRGRFMMEHASRKKPGTRRNYEILWRLHILPTMGNVVVADVTESDVLAFRSKLSARPVNCNRALEVLAKAFTLAERWRWRPMNSNPFRFVEAFPEVAVERVLEPGEVAAVWDALDAPDVLPSARALFRLLMLTGCRLGEWRLALWSWVDFEAAALKLPDSKTGAKIVPLSPEVLDLLRALPRSSVYVLPGEKGGPLGGHRRI